MVETETVLHQSETDMRWKAEIHNPQIARLTLGYCARRLISCIHPEVVASYGP